MMQRGNHHGFYPGLLCLVALLGLSAATVADDFSSYGNYDVRHIVLPEVTGGWFDVIDRFPSSAGSVGPYTTSGRLLVANNLTIFIQKSIGSGCLKGTWQYGDLDDSGLPGGRDNFIPVARVKVPEGALTRSGCMDPSFLLISPDGHTSALGMGWGQPLLVFKTNSLQPHMNELDTPLLNGENGLTPLSWVRFWRMSMADDFQYYWAAWIDEDDPQVNDYRLAVNWGIMGVPFSEVYILDTRFSGSTPVVVITNIPGASAGIALDLNGNMITGIGYDYGPDSRTGEIKMFLKADWEAAFATGTPLDYDTSGLGFVLAETVLSADMLGVDKENNLHVGGGSFLGAVGEELGYAALISHEVVARVPTGGAPVNEDDAGEYRELQPDPLGDDSATAPIVYGVWGEGLSVGWNPRGGNGMPGSDWWGVGVKPILTTYYGLTPPDQDNDDVPDSSDNAYLTYNPGQEDTDEDGWGNACDCDYSQDELVNRTDYTMIMARIGESTPLYDHDDDGVVNILDRSILLTRLWKKPGD